ncbi:MAG TPA: 6-phospho-beta-glucosidase, partial [Candidatus Blautia pullistercoris]|nr:6-phospho-beta-glucosidase [Candidatus Blautia pullistercoris]
VISAKGASPVAYGEMPAAVRGLLQMMKAMEQCTIQAALSGDYGSLLQAFAINPLIPDGAEARRVLDELLVAHEKYLPQFAEIIAKRKKEGVFCEDSVVQNLVRAGR